MRSRVAELVQGVIAASLNLNVAACSIDSDRLRPILDTQTWDGCEVAIQCHDNGVSQRQSNGGNRDVVLSHRSADLFKFKRDSAILERCGGIHQP